MDSALVLRLRPRWDSFGITYALGSQENNPISFKTGKIHFGYVNYF
jgi:hypothetical protein